MSAIKNICLKLKLNYAETAGELFRPNDRSLSAKTVRTFMDRGCYVVSVTDSYGRALGFLDQSRYFSYK
jgi:hypothetical protein